MVSLKEKFDTPESSTKVALTSNILLLILKIYGGFFGGSRALIADSINSLLDIIANSAVWIGIKFAKKPADEGHQYGHGNADVIAASFVAVIILVTGFYIGYDSIHIIVDGSYRVPKYYATAIAAFTILLKAILYKYTIGVGIRYRSPAVHANAQDHKGSACSSDGSIDGLVIAC